MLSRLDLKIRHEQFFKQNGYVAATSATHWKPNCSMPGPAIGRLSLHGITCRLVAIVYCHRHVRYIGSSSIE
eukprot:522285-Pleurochrysis_carterae.AAC.3